MAEKSPRFGGPRPSWELAWTMNWVDRLHTSADKRIGLDGRASWCQVGLPAQSLPRRRFRRALRVFICTFCMRVYTCVCVYVCGHDICIYMHVCMYLYIYVFIHMCMCMCMHICA